MANLDQWGNPIPKVPGATSINISDGTTVPIRSNLKLTSDFTVTDSPETNETIINVAGSPASAIDELTGDVTAEGPGAVAATIAAGAVSLAKMANLAQDQFIGRTTASTGVPQTATITAAARTVLDDTTTANMLVTLGAMADATDLRAYAVIRAKSLLTITNPTVVIDDSFINLPGTANSFWNTVGGTHADVTTKNGGWKSVSTTGTPASTGSMRNGQSGAFVSNVGTQKWYMLWKFAVTSAVDAATRVEIGMIDTGLSADQPTFGVQGATSTTKFRFTDGTAGATSTIDIDTAEHVAEMWCTGDGVIRGSIDSETAVNYTTAKTAAQQAYAQILNGVSAEVRTFQAGHCLYITQ